MNKVQFQTTVVAVGGEKTFTLSTLDIVAPASRKIRIERVQAYMYEAAGGALVFKNDQFNEVFFDASLYSNVINSNPFRDGNSDILPFYFSCITSVSSPTAEANVLLEAAKSMVAYVSFNWQVAALAGSSLIGLLTLFYEYEDL